MSYVHAFMAYSHDTCEVLVQEINALFYCSNNKLYTNGSVHYFVVLCTCNVYVYNCLIVKEHTSTSLRHL